MKHVSIIVCHYSRIDDFGEKAAGKNPQKRSDLLRKCIESLIQNTDYPAELIVMDNGGNPDDSDYLLSKAREGKLTHVRFPQNMNFALAYWILMLVWVAVEATTKPLDLKTHRTSLLLFGLLALIGWALFGAPLHK